MKYFFRKSLLLTGLAWILPLPANAFENLSLVLNTEQQACYSLAMIGMDSVINARLGVPVERALELSSHSKKVSANAESYDLNLLKVMLDAYLWRETPHSYAIKVFYGCAAQSAHRTQKPMNNDGQTLNSIMY